MFWKNNWRDLCTLFLACIYSLLIMDKGLVFSLLIFIFFDWVIYEMDCVYCHESRLSWERASWDLFEPYISWYILYFCSHVQDLRIILYPCNIIYHSWVIDREIWVMFMYMWGVVFKILWNIIQSQSIILVAM